MAEAYSALARMPTTRGPATRLFKAVRRFTLSKGFSRKVLQFHSARLFFSRDLAPTRPLPDNGVNDGGAFAPRRG